MDNKPKFNPTIAFVVVAILIFTIVLVVILRNNSDKPNAEAPAVQQPGQSEEPELEADMQSMEVNPFVEPEGYEDFKTFMQDSSVNWGHKVAALEEFVEENELEPSACWQFPESDTYHTSFAEDASIIRQALDSEEVIEADIRLFLEEFLRLVDNAEDTGSDAFDDAAERFIVASKVVETDDTVCVYDYLDYSI